MSSTTAATFGSDGGGTCSSSGASSPPDPCDPISRATAQKAVAMTMSRTAEIPNSAPGWRISSIQATSSFESNCDPSGIS